MVLIFLWLISLSNWQYSLLSHSWVTFHCAYTHLLEPFIFWWTLSCFHVLVIVNTAAMNRMVQVCFPISVFLFLDKYIEAELLEHMVVIFLIFWGTTTFSTVAIPIYTLTSSAQGFTLLHTLLTLIYLFIIIFLNSHSNRYKVISHCRVLLFFFKSRLLI